MTTPSPLQPPADVAVVIPCLNGVSRGFIGPCLDSVRAQTLRPSQVIVVLDDGTTDDTAAQVAARYPEVEVLRKSGRGLSAARNCGIRHARTTFIALLDDDDEFAPAKLERLVAHLLRHRSVGMAFSRILITAADGAPLREARSAAVGLTYPECLLGNDFLPPSAAVFRRDAMVAAGLFDEGIAQCEDYEFFIRVARVSRVAYVDECLTRYRKHAGQMSESLRQLDDATLAVVRQHVPAALSPAAAAAAVRFYCYGAAVRAALRRDGGHAAAMLRAGGPGLRPLALLLRAVGVLLAPAPPLKVRWRRWELRRVLRRGARGRRAAPRTADAGCGASPGSGSGR